MNIRRLTLVLLFLFVALALFGCRGRLLGPAHTPSPTPMPEPGIEVPVSGGGWQVTLTKAYTDTVLSSGYYPNRSTYTANEGYVFLLVDLHFRDFDPTKQMEISEDQVAIVETSGAIHTASGGGFTDRDLCADCTIKFTGVAGSFSGLRTTFVFTVDAATVGEPWELRFLDVPPIPFAVGETPTHGFTTEAAAIPAVLPPGCAVPTDLSSRADGLIAFQRFENAATVVGALSPTGGLVASCRDLSSGDVLAAPDGALLLQTQPLRGWPSLLLIEPGKKGNKVISLVRNSPALSMTFDSSGRYVIFRAQSLGQEGWSLFVYDRKSGQPTLVRETSWLEFSHLTNSRLLVTVYEKEQERRVGYIWDLASAGDAVDAKVPELVALPASVNPDSLTSDGAHVLQVRDAGSDRELVLSGLDGSAPVTVARSSDWSLSGGALSPDGKSLVIDQWTQSKSTLTLFNVASGDKQTLVQGCDWSYNHFSLDGRWVLVGCTVSSASDAGKRDSTVYVFDAVTGAQVQSVPGAADAYFSPDGSRIAYSMVEDARPVMYLISLPSGPAQSLGNGSLLGWPPAVSWH